MKKRNKQLVLGLGAVSVLGVGLALPLRSLRQKIPAVQRQRPLKILPKKKDRKILISRGRKYRNVCMDLLLISDWILKRNQTAGPASLRNRLIAAGFRTGKRALTDEELSGGERQS